MMRLIIITLALWLFASVAMADVIFPHDPFPYGGRRPRPMPPRNWPPATEQPVAPPVVEQPQHPNLEEVPDDAPGDMRVAVVMVAGFALLIFGASRRLDRRTIA